MADYDPVQHVLSVPSFSQDEIAAVAGGTAMKLFGISR
jgi:hypothetical protein